MADMTLCASKTCAVRERCKRNDACPSAYVASNYQSYAIWHPSAGPNCPGFIDAESEKPSPTPIERTL